MTACGSAEPARLDVVGTMRYTWNYENYGDTPLNYLSLSFPSYSRSSNWLSGASAGFSLKQAASICLSEKTNSC